MGIKTKAHKKLYVIKKKSHEVRGLSKVRASQYTISFSPLPKTSSQDKATTYTEIPYLFKYIV